MSLIYIKGPVNRVTFRKKCEEHGLNPAKVVFLFPGNSSHHSKESTLFSIKSGGGLAAAARALGEQGYPTLSLPTTTMEHWSTDEKQKAIVDRAIKDLYRALGAGYSFILPVRDHTPIDERTNGVTYFFDRGFIRDESLEPSFWGGIQLAANKPLAAYYMNHLDRFKEFAESLTKERMMTRFPNDPLYKAYMEGQLMPQNHPWLHSPRSTNGSYLSAQEPVLRSSMVIPPTYAPIYNAQQDPLLGARALLDDYTKGNSALSRFFHMHWNRHHVTEVNQIVEAIDNGIIKDTKELMERLNQIQLVNPNGSLSKRIYFLEEQFSPSDSNQFHM